jgi:hypothetical protein
LKKENKKLINEKEELTWETKRILELADSLAIGVFLEKLDPKEPFLLKTLSDDKSKQSIISEEFS